MREKRLLDAAGLLATIGAAMLAVAAIKSMLDTFRSLSLGYKVMVTGGTAGVVLGILTAGIWFVQALLSAPSKYVWTAYFVGNVRPDQLEDFHAFCHSVIGDGVASLDRVRSWYEKNPTTLSAIYREQRRGLREKRQLVGFFSVFPVTKEAKELLARNELKGTELVPDQIVSPGHRAAAIYIGGVGAKGFRARERTLGALMGHVASLAPKTPLVFTRPVTKDGLRLVRQQGFGPVKPGPEYSRTDGGMIFVRDLAERPPG